MVTLMCFSFTTVLSFVPDNRTSTNQLNESKEDDRYQSLEHGKWLAVVQEDIIEATHVNQFAREVVEM
jgi:hypothetical protein